MSMKLSRLWRKPSARLAAAALSIAVSQHVQAAWQTLGAGHLETAQNDIVELSTASGARVRVSLLDAGTARIRVAPKGVFDRDFSYAIATQPKPVPLTVERDDHANTLTLRAAGEESLRVVVTLKPGHKAAEVMPIIDEEVARARNELVSAKGVRYEFVPHNGLVRL